MNNENKINNDDKIDIDNDDKAEIDKLMAKGNYFIDKNRINYHKRKEVGT